MQLATAIVLGLFGLIGWFNHLRNLRFKAAIEAKTARFNKIIDQFSDEKALSQFMQSERGLTVFTTLMTSSPDTKSPILVAIGSGIIFLFVGLGAFFLTFMVENDFIYGAVFMSTTGIGLLVASLISLRLSRKWGIFGDAVERKALGVLQDQATKETA